MTNRKITLESVMTRRRVMELTALASAGILTGCAANPVTGQQQLMLVSEAQEIDMDAKSPPHQFSADYGAVQDDTLNGYLARTGRSLAAISHRECGQPSGGVGVYQIATAIGAVSVNLNQLRAP
jgi:predicted Zn-dependent protease